MKRFFGSGLLLVSFLLVLAVQSGYSRPTLGENDVGIAYIISDDQRMQNPVSFTCVQNIAVTYCYREIANKERESFQIARGVSVPCKYLISDAITFDDFQSYECNIYYTISRTDYKPDALAGYPNQIDKYPFSGDLSLRYTPSIIT